MPQPNFDVPLNARNIGPMAAAGPSAPMTERGNWNERLEKNFQNAYAQQLQRRGGQRQRQNEGPPMVAGPSALQEQRVNQHQRAK